MAEVETLALGGANSGPATQAPIPRLNVADRLADFAAKVPDAVAVACARRNRGGYEKITFAALDVDATRIACGLAEWGVRPGMRLALLVPPSVEFVTVVFALLRAGVVIVFVDPGLGSRNLVRCLADAGPDGFVAIPRGQLARVWFKKRFPLAKWNVTVGRRWCWGGAGLEGIRRLGATGSATALPDTRAGDPAAIIFTTGSTGPPKGVLYTHRMFDTQVAEIQTMYGIAPGGVDLSCFPLFALFNSAMGVTTVLPDMDFSRPAAADPRKLLAAARDWEVTQAFASPAVWRNLGAHCAGTGDVVRSLRQIFSCGAPVPAEVLRSTLALAAPNAKMHTPYGATECLPVATIEATEVFHETAARTAEGAGICVGRKFDSIDWRVIRINDDPIATIEEADELPSGDIGELIVRGPQASPQYVTRTACNAAAKVADKRDGSSTAAVWHRMGDVGYFDDQGRFWYCGRKSQRVETSAGPLFTECVEAIFNSQPAVKRSALVGLGPPGKQAPVIIVESNVPAILDVAELLNLARRHPATQSVRHVLSHPALPVDVRHNAKLNREQLAAWAAAQLPELC